MKSWVSKIKPKDASDPKTASPKSGKHEKIDKLKKEIEIDEHRLTIEELCEKYDVASIEDGLTKARAADLLQLHGLNRLTPPKETSKWLKLLKQMLNGFALLLWAGAVLCLVSFFVAYSNDKNTSLGDIWLAIILVCVNLLTGTLQYYQEAKSGKILESFNKMVPQDALVVRDGKKENIPVEELTIGDIVHVQIGQRIPGDIRILKNSGLKVDNSSLTGETEPQSRSVQCTNDNPLETKNLAFFSTFAVEGSAVGMIIRIGDKTAMGRIAILASGLQKRETHLAMELKYFINIVITVSLTLGLIFLVILIAIGINIIDSFVFFIGVVIALVPESLMACLTISLTLTAKRMARKNCLVKHLEAIESLGSIGVICSDKTGTLTMNRMTVSHLWLDNKIILTNLHSEQKESCHKYEPIFEENESYELNLHRLQKESFNFNESKTWKMLTRCAMLCNRAEFRADKENLAKDVLRRECIGDASETAIFQYTEYMIGDVVKYRNEFKKLYEIPFNSTNKYQVSVHEMHDEDGDKSLLVMKGAPERIMAHCKTVLIDNREYELHDEWKKEFNKAYESLGQMGERVFGFCDGVLDESVEFVSDKPDVFPPKTCRLLGLISLIDPPKPNVPAAVEKCLTAGIRVLMVTGDHPITAKAIARAVGILRNETADDIAKRRKIPVNEVDQSEVNAIVLNGTDLLKMNARELNTILLKHKEIVFARTSPQQKLLIVEACQQLGVLVGVTGDGVNDSPAMKKSDIGISMGITGSDVSKQVADMILLDDNFATIVSGIEEGRLLFDNISKIVRYTFTKNMAVLAAFLLYILFATPSAISTITIICIDFGTDIFPMLSLSYEKAESGIMKRKPRDPIRDHLANKNLVSLCYGQVSLIEAAGAFFAYYVCFGQSGFLPSRLIGIRRYWDSPQINDLKDSYGAEWTYIQRRELQHTAQTAFYVGIVITQIFNLISAKTKRASVFKHGFRNMHLNGAIVFTLCIACFLIYVPGLNFGLGLRPLKFLWWLPPIAFGVYLLAYTELIKYLIRRAPNGFFSREFIF